MKIGKSPESLGLEEGDSFTVGVVAVPEYYESNGSLTKEDIQDLIESGALGEGAYLKTELLVDNTSPSVLEGGITKNDDTIEIRTSDNEYVAWVGLMSRSGVVLYTSAFPEQTQEGDSIVITLDTSDCELGRHFVVFVGDYAGNASTYLVENPEAELSDLTGRMYGYVGTQAVAGDQSPTNAWFEIDPEEVAFDYVNFKATGMKVVGASPVPIVAAEYVDDLIFFIGKDMGLYVAEAHEPDYATLITNLAQFDMANGHFGINAGYIYDMAFNYKDGQLYVLEGGSDDTNNIWAINPLTGEAKLSHTVTLAGRTTGLSGKLRAMAIDDDGNFYGASYYWVTTEDELNSSIYRWSAPTRDDQKKTLPKKDITNQQKEGILVTLDNGDQDYYKRVVGGTMTWDHDKDELYLVTEPDFNAGYFNVLFKIKPTFDEEGKTTTKYELANPTDGKNYNSVLYYAFDGLFVVPSEDLESGKDFGATPNADSLSLKEKDVELMVQGTKQVSYTLSPWTLSDRGVTWESEDETIATVDEDGVITGVSEGETNITVTSNATPDKFDSCKVTVRAIPSITLTGLFYGEEEHMFWADFNTQNPEDFTRVEYQNPNDKYDFQAGGMYDGVMYMHNGNSVIALDADDFRQEEVIQQIHSDWLWSDAAQAPKLSNGSMGGLAALHGNGTQIEVLFPEENTVIYAGLTNLEGYVAPCAAIAYQKTEDSDYGTPSNYYYVLDELGNLFQLKLQSTDNRTLSPFFENRKKIGDTGLSFADASNPFSTARVSMEYDSTNNVLIVVAYDGEGEETMLYLIDPSNANVLTTLSFGEGIRPVTALHEHTRLSSMAVKISEETLHLYEGSSVSLDARVVLYNTVSSYTWSSDDPQIVTVDASGTVQALKSGTTTIRAVSEENNSVFASCEVNVTGIAEENSNFTFHAEAKNSQGKADWLKISLSGKEISTQKEKTDEPALTGGGKYGDAVYGTTGDFLSNPFLKKYGIGSYEAETGGSFSSPSFTWLDATGAVKQNVTLGNPEEFDRGGPKGAKGDIFEGPVFLSGSTPGNRTVNVLADFSAGTHKNIGTISASWMPGAAAIAYAGYMPDQGVSGWTNVDPQSHEPKDAQVFFVLSTDGTLYAMAVAPIAMYGDLLYRTDIGKIGNIGFTFDSSAAMSMTTIDLDNDQKVDALLLAAQDVGAPRLFVIRWSGGKLSASYVGSPDIDAEMVSLFSDSEADSLEDIFPAEISALINPAAAAKEQEEDPDSTDPVANLSTQPNVEPPAEENEETAMEPQEETSQAPTAEPSEEASAPEDPSSSANDTTDPESQDDSITSGDVTGEETPDIDAPERETSDSGASADSEPLRGNTPGSLQSITVGATENPNDEDAGNSYKVDKTNNRITVFILASESSNGLFDVLYDSSVLTLEDAKGITEYHSLKIHPDRVRFDYASADRLSTGVTELDFHYDESVESTLKTLLTLTVIQDEDPNAPNAPDTSNPRTEEIVIDLTPHSEQPENPDPEDNGDSDEANGSQGNGNILSANQSNRTDGSVSPDTLNLPDGNDKAEGFIEPVAPDEASKPTEPGESLKPEVPGESPESLSSGELHCNFVLLIIGLLALAVSIGYSVADQVRYRSRAKRQDSKKGR